MRRYDDIDVSVEIGIVCQEDLLRDVFEKYRPEAVFHAAAHKHVPSMELCLREAVRNNVFGALNTVHFGNVLDSNESAIPVFKKGIAEGGPATVADPNIVRFSRPSPRRRVSLFRLVIWFSAA